MKRGTIESYKLFQLFKGLYNQKKDGWLVVKHQQGQRQFYLNRGFPSALRSSFPQDQLLWTLVHDGMCSSSEAAQIELNQLDLHQLYSHLIQNQLVSQDRLNQVLVDLISESMWNTLKWQNGQFEWVESAQAPSLLTPVDPLYVLVLGGVESLSEENYKQLNQS